MALVFEWMNKHSRPQGLSLGFPRAPAGLVFKVFGLSIVLGLVVVVFHVFFRPLAPAGLVCAAGWLGVSAKEKTIFNTNAISIPMSFQLQFSFNVNAISVAVQF